MNCINEQMYGYGSSRSVIRDQYEYGRKRRAEIGDDNLFDFSLGNPSVPTPSALRDCVISLLDETDSLSLHGYTSAQGDFNTRKAVADNLNGRFDAGLGPDDIYMTCGAAAALSITFRALNALDDEIIIFAPYFPEYKVFISSAGAVPVSVPFEERDFQMDLDAFREALSPKTKAVVINSPNNPCGVIYKESTLLELCAILREKSAEYGHPIYIVSDEPYREIVYNGEAVPFIMNLYPDTIMCYSYSKCLSVPGERIGYVAVSPRASDASRVYAAVCGAGRALGYVCAPSLFQKIIERLPGVMPDIEVYRRNRDLLYGSLSEIGYECVHPDGAFYLFIKSLEPDAVKFSLRARDFDILLVPAGSFGAPGYARIAYCTDYDRIRRSIPAFKALFESYR